MKGYSIIWARDIVQQLTDKHPRATKAVLQMLGISAEEAARYLANGDPVWKDLRDLVKVVNKWMSRRPSDASDAIIFEFLCEFSKRNYSKRVSDRLDKRFKQAYTLIAEEKGQCLPNTIHPLGTSIEVFPNDPKQYYFQFT